MPHKPPPNPRSYPVGTRDYGNAVAHKARTRPNIVDSFFAAMAAEGCRVTDVPEWLNRQKGMRGRVTYVRLREWARGTRATPDYAARIMAKKAVPWVLRNVGIRTNCLPIQVLECLAFKAFPWLESSLKGQNVKRSPSSREELWLAAALTPPRAGRHRRPPPDVPSINSRSTVRAPGTKQRRGN